MSTNSNSRPVLDVPAEIVLLIVDHLDLHDLFFLSQTSRRLRSISKRNWVSKLGEMPVEDKLKFWYGLAYVLPDYWACRTCCRLHSVDPLDIPSSYCGRHRIHGTRLLYGYNLQDHHKQLALKYKRLGYDHALEPLLRPHEEIFGSKKYPLQKYSARPKIDNNQFLLDERWTLTPKASLKDRTPRPKCNVTVCAHMMLSATELRWNHEGPKWVISVDGLNERLFLQLWENEPYKQYRCSCSKCLTSLAVEMDSTCCVVVQAFHNYGPFSSPEDEASEVHLRNAQTISIRRVRQWSEFLSAGSLFVDSDAVA
ncbi:hypothetical protein NW762_008459 [Fusarium torreyae]|uniref:F-box domain-containing protein n=1 Tax=Fusarium torreyae TaxID=1237075 RepID=A0A9W8RZ15_9HYPO|nr:hypothetical protein NW762_008459 [Fusarium torreyae]